MHIAKLCALSGIVLYRTAVAGADTLTFIAQPGPGGVPDTHWFNSANWFASDPEGHLSPAGRVPTTVDSAVITGTVDAGSGGVRVQSLLATNNAAITNGNFAVQTVQMLSGSSFNHSTVNLLTSMTVSGTNCQLNATALNVFETATAIVRSTPPGSAATLILANGSVLENSGVLQLTEGSQLCAGPGAQSRLLNTSAGLVSSTNQVLVQGQATNHLVFDNSGVIRCEGGTLRFGDGLSWRASDGAGEFRTASTNALVLFTAPFEVPAAVTDLFSGPGTHRWLAGAEVNGATEVTGHLDLIGSVSGAGQFRVLNKAGSAGTVTWSEGALSLSQVTVGNGANLLVDGHAEQSLVGCAVINSGLLSFYGGEISFGDGATVTNLVGGILAFPSTNPVTLWNTKGGGSINNFGIVQKSGGGTLQFGVSPDAAGPEFNNAGLLHTTSGELRLVGGVSSGEFRTGAGSVLWFWGGTHRFNAGATFTGPGSIRVLQGLSAPSWIVTDAIDVPMLELGFNGSIEASGNTSGKAVHFGWVSAEANGRLSNGKFEVLDGEMLDQSTLNNCALRVLGTLNVLGTNCSLRSASLEIAEGATVTLRSTHSDLPAVLNLEQGSAVQADGVLELTDGAQISATLPPQSRIAISPSGVLESSDRTLIAGSATNHLLFDNSGLVEANGGALSLAGGMDWKSSSARGEFRAAATNAWIVFATPFSVDAGVTNFFTGPGTNRWLAGASLAGTAQVGTSGPEPVPGNLELWESVSGSGTLTSQAGLVTWLNGTLGQPLLNIGIHGGLHIPEAPGTRRHLSKCRVNNSGHWTWQTQADVLAGSGTVLNNSGGGVLDLRSDANLSFDGSLPMTALNNSGTFLKSEGTGVTVLAADFKNSGSVDIQSGTVEFLGYWVQTAGNAQVAAGATLSAGSLQIQGGQLAGKGTLDGTVHNAAVVSPGLSPGALVLSPGRDYEQSPIATLKIEIGGHSAGLLHDQLIVGGSARLAGRLQVSSVNGFKPQLGDAFVILTCSSQTGTFSSIDPTGIPGTCWQPRYYGTNVTLVLTTALRLSPLQLTADSVRLSFPTTPGQVYLVQATGNLAPPDWQTIRTITGDGTVQTLSDTISATQRFYRIALQ